MPTRSVPSRKPATSSTAPPPSACTTTSIRPAARAIRRTPMSPSVAASRRRTRCCAGAACSKALRLPEVTSTMHRLLGLLLLAGIVLGTVPAEAHPHVWITARSEVVYAPDGSMTGVRHAWTFDDMFTTYALQGLEAK